jgi:hypothetical protein
MKVCEGIFAFKRGKLWVLDKQIQGKKEAIWKQELEIIKQVMS